MSNIQFSQMLGCVYDAFFVFNLYYNKDHYLKRTHSDPYHSFEIVYYQNILKEVPDYPDELSLFFHFKDDHNFITDYCLNRKDVFESDFTFQKIIQTLSNCQETFCQLIRFYFDGFDGNKCDTDTLSKAIMQSRYPVGLKYALMAFLQNPSSVINKLICELTAVEESVRLLHNKHHNTEVHFQETLDSEELLYRLTCIKYNPIDLSDCNHITIAYCIHNKNCIKAIRHGTDAVLFLGFDFSDRLDTLILGEDTISLTKFGSIISEPLRVEILRVLSHDNRLEEKEIAEALRHNNINFDLYSMSDQLSIMGDAGIIRVHSIGYFKQYSIVRGYLKEITDILYDLG